MIGAACAELFERYLALGADGAPDETIELIRTWTANDLDRLRGCYRSTSISTTAGAPA